MDDFSKLEKDPNLFCWVSLYMNHKNLWDDFINWQEDSKKHGLFKIWWEQRMPLISGKEATSKKGFSQNIKTEMAEGKPQKQSVAIAYSKKREDQKVKGKKK